jgi:coproporphyrinogen III oxidase-like Fe-S oxidoreductase
MNVDFYIHYDDNGTPTSISQETVAELFDALKNFFGKIPNVTITEVN